MTGLPDNTRQDVETIRDALENAERDVRLLDGREFDPSPFKRAYAALDRLAASRPPEHTDTLRDEAAAAKFLLAEYVEPFGDRGIHMADARQIVACLRGIVALSVAPPANDPRSAVIEDVRGNLYLWGVGELDAVDALNAIRDALRAVSADTQETR